MLFSLLNNSIMAIIKSLGESEVKTWLTLIRDCESLWGPHNRFGGTPLIAPDDYARAGETIWLHRRDDDEWINYNSSSANQIVDILKSYRDDILPGARFGRVYVHRLKPGKIVSRHRDVNDPKYFAVVKRHQVYFDIPESCEIESGSAIVSNSVVWFDHRAWHSYTNNSDRELIFVVFDLLDEPVEKL